LCNLRYLPVNFVQGVTTTELAGTKSLWSMSATLLLALLL